MIYTEYSVLRSAIWSGCLIYVNQGIGSDIDWTTATAPFCGYVPRGRVRIVISRLTYAVCIRMYMEYCYRSLSPGEYKVRDPPVYDTGLSIFRRVYIQHRQCSVMAGVSQALMHLCISTKYKKSSSTECEVQEQQNCKLMCNVQYR